MIDFMLKVLTTYILAVFFIAIHKIAFYGTGQPMWLGILILLISCTLTTYFIDSIIEKYNKKKTIDKE